ncbi:hypothetical protein Pmar_PMAR019985, partial [Perkinsus marinus ATCC 50983]
VPSSSPTSSAAALPHIFDPLFKEVFVLSKIADSIITPSTPSTVRKKKRRITNYTPTAGEGEDENDEEEILL